MRSKKDHREFFEVFRASPDEVKSGLKSSKLVDNTKDVISKDEGISKEDNLKTKDVSSEKWAKNIAGKIVAISDNNLKTKVITPRLENPEPPKRVIQAEEPLKTVRDDTETFSGKVRALRKEEVKLKQETIIIGAVAATFLSLACFFVGYKVGYNKGINPDLENRYSINDENFTINAKDGKDVSKSTVNILSNDLKNTGIADIKRSTEDLWTLRIISYKFAGSNIEKAEKLVRAIKNLTGTKAFVAKAGNELIVCVGKFKDNNDSNLIDLQIKMSDIVYEDKKQFKGCYPVKIR